ncbi:C-type mannose receptor 2-like isoform 2-T2 [Odontesthes bonariensis]|uniref:C-type mannose receptor 2-like isoform X2 n=1 Tax=Odontesthes bonariensis TaxID=219752 RepID=UPI003F58CA21
MFLFFHLFFFKFFITMYGKRLVAMRRTSALPMIVITVFCSCSLGSSEFHHINMSKTYDEAKRYCREMYTDLATVHSSDDMNELIEAAQTDRAWIGLEAENVSMWHWSLSDQKTNYFNWNASKPQQTIEEACASMDENGKWFSVNCAALRSFVCHGNDEASNANFFDTPKSWRDAQSHCRNLSSDLVTIHSAQKNEAVKNVSESKDVWIGLFRDHWKWSDGSNSSFRFWKPNRPNKLDRQKCVAAIFIHEGKWNNRNCITKFNFICQGAPTTASELTTRNTTEFVSHPTSTEHSNATKLHPTTTTSTLMPTANSHSLHLVNLILIQKNMTWIEAMSYCREHYIDLVHITTQYIQDKVAEKAKNATSPHVWLGLRYTCNFKFWFWIQSTSSCYQNWAPGHGPEGVNECGVSGAIEATGGQQWVGLLEREELNFICNACAG